MHIIRKSQAVAVDNNSSKVLEYDFGDADIDIAYIRVEGRYPITGRVTNEISKESCYIVEGSGTIYVEEEPFSFSAGDALLIQPGERFYWEGNMTMVVPSTPAWKPEQHRQVD